MGQTKQKTRDAIKDVALAHFCRNGYRGTNLEEVARELGITRSAVLFHFRTKADLVREITEPLVAEMERLLGHYSPIAPLGAVDRSQLLYELVDCCLRHRDIVLLMSYDVTCHDAIGMSHNETSHRMAILTELFYGPEPTLVERLRMRGVIGAILRPLLEPDLDVDDPVVREAIVDIGLEVADALSWDVPLSIARA